MTQPRTASWEYHAKIKDIVEFDGPASCTANRKIERAAIHPPNDSMNVKQAFEDTVSTLNGASGPPLSQVWFGGRN